MRCCRIPLDLPTQSPPPKLSWTNVGLARRLAAFEALAAVPGRKDMFPEMSRTMGAVIAGDSHHLSQKGLSGGD